jgi:hypothetical protein
MAPDRIVAERGILDRTGLGPMVIRGGVAQKDH